MILLDSNFLGSSGNIKVVPVQNFGSIGASIWAPEAKRMTTICRPDEVLMDGPFISALSLSHKRICLTRPVFNYVKPNSVNIRMVLDCSIIVGGGAKCVTFQQFGYLGSCQELEH